LIRLCEIIANHQDGRKAVGIDKQNRSILSYVNQSERHLRNSGIFYSNYRRHKNSDLYDKENINENCKDVAAMKFFKGQRDDRIYCKEPKQRRTLCDCNDRSLQRKKSQKVSKKKNP